LSAVLEAEILPISLFKISTTVITTAKAKRIMPAFSSGTQTAIKMGRNVAEQSLGY